jgi:hypothetical protein
VLLHNLGWFHRWANYFNCRFPDFGILVLDLLIRIVLLKVAGCVCCISFHIFIKKIWLVLKEHSRNGRELG